MANQPDPNTVATSFTLPRQLFEAVKKKAKKEMTNQSDIVRRALMNYLPPVEREAVRAEMDQVLLLNDESSSIVQAAAIAAAKKAVQIVENEPVNYRRKRQAGSSSGKTKPPTPSAQAR